MSNRCPAVHRTLPQTQPLVRAAGCSTAQLLVRSVRAAQGSSSYPSSSWVKNTPTSLLQGISPASPPGQALKNGLSGSYTTVTGTLKPFPKYCFTYQFRLTTEA